MQSLHLFLLSILVLSSFFVLVSSNPVHSVLFLVFTIFNASLILFFFNVEFLALIFIIVYVGAIAVLFLFVIMMLNIKMSSSKMFLYYPVFFIVSFIVLIQIFLVLEVSFSDISVVQSHSFSVFDVLNNIEVIGQSLYNYFLCVFLLAGLILLVAMIGAIILTLNFSSVRKNELAFRQLSRNDNSLTFF